MLYEEQQVEQEKVLPRLKFWPSPADYSEAMQCPEASITDPSMSSYQVETDALGLPKPISGGFASVYRLKATGQPDWALRCFLNSVANQQTRYEKISNYIMNDDLPYTVSFDYIAKGLRIRSEEFPALKMEWIEGDTLEQYVEKNLGKPAIAKLAEKFKRMCADLSAAGIAHGDLQHGNIMVTPDNELRLVDYDGMYVPALEGQRSNELGHRNYQHPARREVHFGPALDNFSALVIYVSLRALALDPSLYKKLNAGDDCLLFRQEDFTSPLTSKAFHILENSRIKEIRQLAQCLRAQLLESNPLNVIPLSAVQNKTTIKLPPLRPPGTAAATPVGVTAPPQHTKEDDVNSWEAFLEVESIYPHLIERELRKKSRLAVLKPCGYIPFLLVFGALTSILFWLHLYVFMVALAMLLMDAMGKLVSSGVPTAGQIYMKYESGARHVVWYRFAARGENGRYIRRIAEMNLSKKDWESVNVGDRLTVLYDREDPHGRSVIYKFGLCKVLED